MPRVLISSVAAKVQLVRSFKDAGFGAVYTCDTALVCAGGLAGDRHFQVRSLTEQGFLEQLVALCQDFEIDAIVPTRDGELNFFSENAARFQEIGTKVIVPPPDRLMRCQNKLEFTRALCSADIPVMPALTPQQASDCLPVFVRPIYGAAGIGARRVDTSEQLQSITEAEPVLINRFIEAPEYSIDLLMNLDGSEAIQAVCRERIQVVGGESKVSKTVDHPRLTELSLKLGLVLGLVGHNTIQAFDHPKEGIRFIEVNPRFGGASNLSIRAGLESPAKIRRMLEGKRCAPSTIRYGLTMYRYSEDYLVE